MKHYQQPRSLGDLDLLGIYPLAYPELVIGYDESVAILPRATASLPAYGSQAPRADRRPELRRSSVANPVRLTCRLGKLSRLCDPSAARRSR